IIPRGLEDHLNIDAEVMHGDLCFRGTRVPMTVLLDNIAEGMGLEEFLQAYPSVSRNQVLAVLEWESRAIREAAGMR
ncbi:DUF433 domain-containing protein, partial [Pseudomonas sp. FW306-07-L]|uniref:DUF433 domain-containing protein n=1 Tax=Pseudomonas sp. FW306-07-L TaxID=2070598 RepID=UPI001C494FA5